MVFTRCFGHGIHTFCLVIPRNWMKECVDQVTLEEDQKDWKSIPDYYHSSIWSVFVCVCVYLGNLCGASHQVVDIVIELQLPLGCYFFNLASAKHHFAGETREKEKQGMISWSTLQNLM